MFRNNLSRKNLIIRSILAVIVLAVMGLCWIYQDSIFPGTAYADSEYHSDVLVDGYSLVLDDLKQDSSFDPEDYPEDNEDYSLSIFQIAESEDDELFLYVYQPYTGSKFDLTAYKVSISVTVGDGNLKYVLYDLTLLNYDGVFYKYRVDDLTVSGASVHYYDISAIYRPFYTSIDGDNVFDNTTGGLGISVGQEWTVAEYNGSKVYYLDELRVVELTPYVSWVRYYSSGFTGWSNSDVNIFVDRHFVAFNCDFDIDFLYEADVSFDLVHYSSMSGLSSVSDFPEHDRQSFNPLTVTYDTFEEVTVSGPGVFKKKKYGFTEIQTSDDFIYSVEHDSKGNSVTDVEYSDDDIFDFVSNCDYILNFYETDGNITTTKMYGKYYYYGNYYAVEDFTILRLKYEFQGEVFDVGVVSCIVSENPDHLDGSFAEVEKPVSGLSCWDSIVLWFWIILGILVFILLLPVLPYIVKAVIWIICAPFKFIRWCYRKNKERKRKKQEKQDQKKADQEQKNKDQNIQVKDFLSSGIKLDSSIKFDVPDVSDDSGKSGKDKKKKNE